MEEAAARKAKLGQRWQCFKCNARFYDLNKPDPLCPKCGADQHESPAFQKPGKKRAVKKAVAVPRKEAPPALPPEDLEVRRERDEEADEEFSDDAEFDLEDLELEEAGGDGDEDKVGLVEVEED